MSQSIIPKTITMKDPNGNLYVATQFDVIGVIPPQGSVQQARPIFKDAVGNIIPTQAFPLTPPLTPQAEQQDLAAAIAGCLGLAGETIQAHMTRAGASVIVLTRGVTLTGSVAK